MTAASRRTRAAVAVVAAALAVVGSTASPATAHNGVGAAFKGPAGPYTVYAYDGYPIPAGRLEYRLILLDRRFGQPVEDVEPAVTARPLGARTPVRTAPVNVMANVVLYDLPNPYPGDWSVTVRLRGQLGRGAATFAMHGSAPFVPADIQVVNRGATPTWLLVCVAGAGVVAAATIALWWRRRRRRPGQV
jgi:hypothetical protein